jgi:hypothetical protein
METTSGLQLGDPSCPAIVEELSYFDVSRLPDAIRRRLSVDNRRPLRPHRDRQREDIALAKHEANEGRAEDDYNDDCSCDQERNIVGIAARVNGCHWIHKATEPRITYRHEGRRLVRHAADERGYQDDGQ